MSCFTSLFLIPEINTTSHYLVLLSRLLILGVIQLGTIIYKLNIYILDNFDVYFDFEINYSSYQCIDF